MASLFPFYKRGNRTRERGGLIAPRPMRPPCYHHHCHCVLTGKGLGRVGGDVCGGGVGGENITLHRLWALSPLLR